MSRKTKGSILLLITSIIWGTAFVTQKSGMDHIEPFTFNGIRMFIGALVLLPFIRIGRLPGSGRLSEAEKAANRNDLFLGAISCGAFIFIGTSLQQIGLQFTSAGKSGFVTALYVVIVPLLGLFIHRKVAPLMWGCVAAAIAGLYLLCVTGESLTIGKGDLITLACSFAFALQIYAADRYSTRVNPLALSCFQFFTCGILSLPFIFIFETPHIADILACAPQLLYTGVLSCGIAYTLQILGQRDAEPAVASLILSLESFFAALSGALFLGESMTGRELIGCSLMLAAIIVSQTPHARSDRA